MQKRLISALVSALESRSGQTARELARTLQDVGFTTEKRELNWALYRHPERFAHDGGLPPRWSLSAQDVKHDRAPHLLRILAVFNWKAFEQASVGFADINLLFGDNSSGKSSIFQALLLMKQSWGKDGIQFNGAHGEFGWYQHVVHRHEETKRDMTFLLSWGAGENVRGALVEVPRGPLEETLNPTHPIESILCVGSSHTVRLVPAWTRSDLRSFPEDSWLLDARQRDEPTSTSQPSETPAVVLAGDGNGFPDPGRPLTPGQEGGNLAHVSRVLREATEMLDSLVHIGATRALPPRDISSFWAEQHAPHLVRLLEDDDGELIADVNEWLRAFEVPYELSVVKYGEGPEGDEQFEITLRRGDGEAVQLRDIGYGISQLLPIVVTLLASRESTILIEEPEAHLHPRLQSVLADLFVASAQDYGNVVVAETHSEGLLLRLQRRIAEKRVDRKNVTVHHVLRDGMSSRVERVGIKENGQLDYEWPGGFFDDRMDDLVAILDPVQPE